MKKLRVQSRIEDDKPIFFIKILKLELRFWEEQAANGFLDAFTQLLRRNGGLAKKNEREKMANILAERGLVSAADLVRGRTDGKPTN